MSIANTTVRDPELIARVMRDPAWFPIDLDRATSELLFAQVNYGDIAAHPFLTSEFWNVDGLPLCRVGLEALLDGLASEKKGKPHLNYLWHTGFCCSTLLARALEHPDRNLSLREPAVFARLADLKRDGILKLNQRSGALSHLIFQLLGRPLSPGMQVTVKPTNAANYLIPEAATQSTGKHLFLFGDCRSFLNALVRRGQKGATYARTLFIGIAGDGNDQNRWPMQKLFEMSDLQIAALGWHMEVAQFNRTFAVLGPKRAMSLDCDIFLQSPAATLNRLDEFFELGLGGEHIAGLVEGPLLQRNAKNGAESFGPVERQREQESIGPKLSQQIDDVVGWSYEVCTETPPGFPLPNPAMPSEKTYRP